MIKTIKCDYCHGQNAIRLSFPGVYSWYNEATIDSSTGLSDQHEVYVCKDCGKVMLKKVGETLEIVEKILDAEGVSIEVGDTVYCDDDPEPFRVVLFDEPEHVYLTLAKDPNNTLLYKMKPSRLSHKHPILDADGVPINVGDIAEAKGEWRLYSVSPENLTHERHDSWERIDEDLEDIVRRVKELLK